MTWFYKYSLYSEIVADNAANGHCTQQNNQLLLKKTAELFMNQFENKMWTFRPIISDILHRNFQTELFEILLK